MASKAIKGITVEIGGNTTKLDKALKSSQDRSKELQTQLTEVNKALKFNPDNVELLTQKQAMLTERIEETSKELDILKNAQEQVQKQFDNNEIGIDQYRAFQREIVATESKINTFTNQLEECASALTNAQNKVNGNVSAFDKLSSTIDEQQSELQQLAEEYTNVVLSQGKSSDEAKELAKRISTLNTDLQANKERMNDAQGEAKKLASALDDAGQGAESSGDGFTIMGGALADLVSSAIQGAISAIGNLIGSLFELSEATEEYRQMQAKLEGASKRAGYSAEYATNLYKLMYQFLGDDQMATNAVTNLLGIGASQETLNSLLDGARGVWASYGDSIPIESLTEAINETIQVGKVTGTFADTINWVNISNEEMANSLGKGSKAQKAFNKAIKEGETQEDAFSMALSATSDQQERAKIVAQFLNDTYDESSETYEELAGSMLDANRAEVELKETQAKLGEAMEPVNTAIKDMKAKALEAILPIVEDVSQAFLDMLQWLKEHPTAMKILTAVVIALANAFGVLATALGIQTLIQGVTGAFKMLGITMSFNPATIWIAGITALVAGILYLWNTCDGFREGVIAIMNAILTFFSDTWATISNFFTVTIPETWSAFLTYVSEFCASISQFFTNLWNGIISFFTETIPAWIQNVIAFFQQIPYYIGYMVGYVIAQFIQWGIDLWNFATVTIPNFISETLKWFGSLPGKIWNAIVSAISNIANWGTQIYNTAKSKISSMISSVVSYCSGLPGKIWNAIVGAVSNVTKWGSNLVSEGKKSAKKLLDSVVNGLKSLPSKMLDVGKDAIRGLWNGINDMAGWIGKKIKSFGDGVLSGIKDFFGIHSPSRVFKDEVGRYLAQGIGVGIEENADEPIHAMETLGDDMLNTARGINGITLKRQLDTTFTSTAPQSGESVIELVKLVSEYFPKLIEASKHAIVLDSGALVGETINQMDEQMALLYELKARGV